MDLALSPEHEAFQRRVRAWLKANVPKREPDDAMRGHSEPGARAAPQGVATQALRRRLRRHGLAEAVRRPGRRRDGADDRQPGARAGARAAADRHDGRADGRADADPVRQRRAEAALPAAHPQRRGDLVPGLLRARRGLRSRIAEDARRAGRRRVHRQRPEGVDLERADRRLDVLPRAHRSVRHPSTAASRTSSST